MPIRMRFVRRLAWGLEPARAHGPYPATTWGWLRCWYYHRATWRYEEETPKQYWPPGIVLPSEMLCVLCRGDAGYALVR